MLKGGGQTIRKQNIQPMDHKKGSNKPTFVGALASGLNRRAFLKQSSAAVMLATIAACKPNNEKIQSNDAESSKKQSSLSQNFALDQHQKDSISAVQMQLLPEDGDGPSAKDINGLAYLQWTLTDPDNLSDGDGEFIVKGVGWLDSLSEQTQGDQFVALTNQQQDKVLKQISQSSAGENWLSILIYYLMEALLFDPYYGGNPNGIGWKWLKHQPGFPAPDEKTNYRNFL